MFQLFLTFSFVGEGGGERKKFATVRHFLTTFFSKQISPKKESSPGELGEHRRKYLGFFLALCSTLLHTLPDFVNRSVVFLGAFLCVRPRRFRRCSSPPAAPQLHGLSLLRWAFVPCQTSSANLDQGKLKSASSSGRPARDFETRGRYLEIAIHDGQQVHFHPKPFSSKGTL